MTNLKILSLLFSVILLFTFSCKDDDDFMPVEEDPIVEDTTMTEPVVHFFNPGPDNQVEVTEIFINVAEDEIIEFGEGTFSFTNTLSMINKNCITIRGAGRNKTTLDFSNQISGSDGLKLTATNNILIEGLTVKETYGDGIKVNDSDGVTMVDVGAEWEAEASDDNGAYGLYPVTCKNVLLDNCYVKGASDAGIYVGQSEYIHVKNCEVEKNVAGIEIENSNFAEVYNCHAHNNTGGILVFDLPGLSLVNGHHCKIYDNIIESNDFPNFAPAGNIVGTVPSGTGIMLLSCDQVEIYNNNITNNNVMGIGIISQLTLDAFEGVTSEYTEFSPYPNNINIHNNTFSRTNDLPEVQTDMGTFLTALFMDTDITTIIFDGTKDPNGVSICQKNNGDIKTTDLDAPNGFLNINRDAQDYNCEGNTLAAVELMAAGCE